MPKVLPRIVSFALVAFAATAARADFVGILQPGPIDAGTSVAFANSNVVPGTTSSDGLYNFLDEWTFTLNGSFEVSSIAAAINFRDPDGNAMLFGISNLQVNLVTNPPSGSPIVSWLSVSMPTTGLQSVVALTPTSALGAGNYALEIRGDVVQPGSYSGSLLAQPLAAVPLPRSMGLFVAGLGVFALGVRRRHERERTPV